MEKSKRLRHVLLAGAAAALLAAAAGFLCAYLSGWIQFNQPSRERFPLRGVDVSSYQGDIDWEALRRQGVSFAFIKATEGSGSQDLRFADNWQGATNASLYAGAYHFFSYDSPGETQADNYIGTVPRQAGTLPPVVDVEFYGDWEKHPPGRSEVEPELKALLNRLEEAYGVKPILYATGKAYTLFLQGDYEEYPLWIRNVLTEPSLPDGRGWTFWQYTDKGWLDGYRGKERFIDLNVFHGSEEELKALLIPEF
jgi:lysozyme